MKKNHFAALFSLFMLITGLQNPLMAQDAKPANKPFTGYRETTAKINDLVHTKLDVHFDYKKRFMYGREWITLQPHFYATDSLRLDAKGMDIHRVSLVNNGRYAPLQFSYDSLSLNIKLNKAYNR